MARPGAVGTDRGLHGACRLARPAEEGLGSNGRHRPLLAGRVGGRAFVLSRLGEDEVVTAFEVQSGKQVWQQRYRGRPTRSIPG